MITIPENLKADAKHKFGQLGCYLEVLKTQRIVLTGSHASGKQIFLKRGFPKIIVRTQFGHEKQYFFL